jgi:hypothetical protein
VPLAKIQELVRYCHQAFKDRNFDFTGYAP